MNNTTGYIVYALATVVACLYAFYCLREIVRRKGMKHTWFAWIPPLNVYYLCRATGMGVAWAVIWTPLLLLPYLNALFPVYAAKTISALIGVFFTLIIFLKLARACGRRRWFGLLLLIPIVNYFAMWSLAFGPRKYPDEEVQVEEGNAGVPTGKVEAPQGAL